MDDGKYVQIPGIGLNTCTLTRPSERTSLHMPQEDKILSELETLLSDDIVSASNDIVGVSNDVEWMEQVLVGRVDAEATHQEDIKKLRILNENTLRDVRHMHETEKDALCRQYAKESTKERSELCQIHTRKQKECADSVRQAERQVARMVKEIHELKLQMKTQAEQYLTALQHGAAALRKVQQLI